MRAGKTSSPYSGWRNLDRVEIVAEIKRRHCRVGIEIQHREWDDLVLALFERYVEPGLIQPCHVMLHPARSTVLCKWRRGPLPNGYELVSDSKPHLRYGT